MEINPYSRLFEQHRSLMTGIAYRMLGRMSEAEDIVQDAWLRWRGVHLSDVDNPAAYLASAVTRLCIDRQRRQRVERLLYTGPWLPEPVGDDYLEAADPGKRVETGEQVSIAFMLLLEKLQPLERAVFILREAFDLSHEDISAMLDIRSTHSRQLLRRAKQRMQGDVLPASEPAELEPLMARFMEAAQSGDLEGLKSLMTEDIIAYSDGGGRVSAALIPLVGPDRVATVLMHLWQRGAGELSVEWRNLNGGPAIVLRQGEEIHSTHSVVTRDSRIHRIYTMRNPGKLAYVT